MVNIPVEQEWAVQHPDGGDIRITVRVDGQPFHSARAAKEAAEECDELAQNDGCDCGLPVSAGKHEVVVRDVTRSPWRSV